VRSAALPFALLLGAAAPLLVSYYHDLTGAYTGALLVVAGLNVLSGLFVQLIPPPKGRVAAVATTTTGKDDGSEPGADSDVIEEGALRG
jgi:hypothetical protein